MLKYTFRVALVTVLASFGFNAHATLALFDYGYNVDGVFTNTLQEGFDVDPSTIAGLDESGFDFFTGVGSVTMTFDTVGAHNFVFFVDHEIDQAVSGFTNEFIDAVGTPEAGQSYEGDEPGFVFGDIYDNVAIGALDNSLNDFDLFPEDASMAMGFDLMLAAGEVAVITMTLAEQLPSMLPSFYMVQSDELVSDVVYFWATLSITPAGPPPPTPVTAPAALGLLMLGFLALGQRRRLAR